MLLQSQPNFGGSFSTTGASHSSRMRAKTCFRYRYPHAPNEAIFVANSWNFETTANKNVLAVNYTDIAVELSARIALRLRNLKPMIRRLAGEVERQIVELRSTTATSPYIIHLT